MVFPNWLTSLIILFLKYFPLTWLSVKRLQSIVSNLSNNMEVNVGTYETIITMLLRSTHFISRYYLTCMLHDIQHGVSFSKATLHFFEGENTFFASMIQEASSGNHLKVIFNKLADFLHLKTRMRFNFYSIVIPSIFIIIICLYIAHLISYYVTGFRYNILVMLNRGHPNAYPYSTLMTVYESIFQSSNFVFSLLLYFIIGVVCLALFHVFRSSFLYPKWLSILEMNIPLLRQKRQRMLSIEFFKLLTVARLSKLNIYNSLHRAKLSITNKHVLSGINNAIALIDQGVPANKAIKSIDFIQVSTYYILDRLVICTSHNDLEQVSEICSYEYIAACRLLNESYRFIFIILIISLIVFIGLNYYDNVYIYDWS